MIGMTTLNVSPAQKLNDAAVEKQTNGEIVEAERLYREALAIDPMHSLAAFNLGVILLEQNQFGQAAKLFMSAWDSNPNHVECALNFVYALQNEKNNDAIKPHFPKFISVARKLYEAGDVNGAVRLANLLVSLDSTSELPDAHWIRANAMMQQGEGMEALAAFDALSRTWPQFGLSCLCNIAALQWRLLGDADQAMIGARRLIGSGKPGDSFEPVALDILLKTLPYHAATMMFDLTEISERRRKLNAGKRAAVASSPVADPEGKLRVAFLIDRSVGSGASRAISELIRNLPAQGIEPALHFITAAPSAGGFDGLSDEEAAKNLRSLKYDVVIDATDPSVTEAPGLFDFRAAPVQLAYPYRVYPTASSQIDVALATPEMISVDEADKAQTWLTLPGAFIGSAPLSSAPAPTPCPSIANGYVTFGAIGPAGAMGYSALDAYASVLISVPNSRLTIVNELAGIPEYRTRILERLKRNGVAETSVAFSAATAHGEVLNALKNIDIVLDSFPTPGFLTADIAWQGVFSVGFGGGMHPIARRALATYKALSMDDLVAPNRDDFVTIAVALAQDAQRRMDFRANARSAYEGIPLFDGKAFARDFAATLRSACRLK